MLKNEEKTTFLWTTGAYCVRSGLCLTVFSLFLFLDSLPNLFF